MVLYATVLFELPKELVVAVALPWILFCIHAYIRFNRSAPLKSKANLRVYIPVLVDVSKTKNLAIIWIKHKNTYFLRLNSKYTFNIHLLSALFQFIERLNRHDLFVLYRMHFYTHWKFSQKWECYVISTEIKKMFQFS